jgi:23S rRNA (guanosine2251-2'-O)-methyltransferase
VAVAPPFRYAPLERLLQPACPSALVLEGVQDPRNLGAILRTARAVVTAAAGVLFGLPVAQVPNLVRAMEALKEAGFWLVALVPRGGTLLEGFETPSRPALVAGGEGEGLRALARRTCDFAVSIPMAAGVESLNVSVAVGIALHGLTRRRDHS